MNTIQTISPIDGQVYVERQKESNEGIARAVEKARAAQLEWREWTIAERATWCTAAIDALLEDTDAIAVELAHQMGRPVRFGPGELAGTEERARYMIDTAEAALADIHVGEMVGFNRFIRRVPLGTVLTIAPWNYPFLTTVNSIIPALMAGNAVILKHAANTMLAGERFARAFDKARLPDGIFQHLVLDNEQTGELIGGDGIDMVCFTGSVAAGRIIEKAAAGRFVPVGLELGGKDPAYVRADADLSHAVESIADGAFFNSGQSCCGIERVYVHASAYDEFVAGLVTAAHACKLGDPLDTDTTLGPLIKPAAADFVRRQIADAVAAGATANVDTDRFRLDQPGSAFLAPQVLTHVTHAMNVMQEESFGPVVGIMRVEDDDEAVALMNDSRFGLTASIWTRDESAAIAIGDQLQTGTVFMNRCDYLDPALVWTGVKDTGRGCSLSALGYQALTRPKSFNLRIRTSD